MKAASRPSEVIAFSAIYLTNLFLAVAPFNSPYAAEQEDRIAKGFNECAFRIVHAEPDITSFAISPPDSRHRKYGVEIKYPDHSLRITNSGDSSVYVENVVDFSLPPEQQTIKGMTKSEQAAAIATLFRIDKEIQQQCLTLLERRLDGFAQLNNAAPRRIVRNVARTALDAKEPVAP